MVYSTLRRWRSFWKSLTVFTLLVSLIYVSPSYDSDNFQEKGYTRSPQSSSYYFQPLIVEVTQMPLIVEYFQTVNVTAFVLNNNISTVELNFRTNGGNWNCVLMTNSTNVTFMGNILPQPYDTYVQYYVNVTDILGFSTIGENNGSYYNYRVVDTVPPIIQITSPNDTTVFYGLPRMVYTSWEDAGSGLDYIEVYIDGVLDVTYSGVTSWGSTIVPEGSHQLTFIAYDKAGNNAQLSRRFTYVPDPEPPIQIPAFPFSSIILGLVIAIIISFQFSRIKNRN